MFIIDRAPINDTWETIICGLEICIALCISLYMLYRKSSQNHLIFDSTSHHPISPMYQCRNWCSFEALFLFRCLAAGFFIIVQCYDFYRTEWKCLAFYTSWNFMVEGFYFFRTAKKSYEILQERRERTKGSDMAYTLLLHDDTNEAVPAHRGWICLEFIFDVILSTSILIAIVVWTLLYPIAHHANHPEVVLNWVSYCQHGLNVLILQIDFWATKHTVSLDALPLVIAWPTLYAIFAWLIHGTIFRGFWPYPFLELSTPYAPLWYAGILFAHVMTFYIMFSLSRLREKASQ